MSALLAEAIAELGLEPGQTYTTTVGDREIEIRVRDAAAPAEPVEESSQFADMVMLDPWFTIPDPPGIKVSLDKVRFEPDWPAPYVIDESDLAPE